MDILSIRIDLFGLGLYSTQASVFDLTCFTLHARPKRTSTHARYRSGKVQRITAACYHTHPYIRRREIEEGQSATHHFTGRRHHDASVPDLTHWSLVLQVVRRLFGLELCSHTPTWCARHALCRLFKPKTCIKSLRTSTENPDQLQLRMLDIVMAEASNIAIMPTLPKHRSIQ